MKIAYLSDDFPPQSFGGAGIVAFNLAKKMKEAGNDIFVITSVRRKEEEGVFDYDGLKIYKIYSDYHERWRAYLSLYNPFVVGRIREILRKEKPDVVHAHNIHYYLSYHSLKIAKELGAKVFLTAHDVMLFHYGKFTEFIAPKNLSIPKNFDYKINALDQLRKFKRRYNPFRNIIIRHYLKNIDKIFSVSNELKDALSRNGIDNVEVIHNGISADNWKKNEEKVCDFKKRHRLSEKKIILFGGRLSASKGGGQAISAMDKVCKTVKNSVLLVIGEKGEFANQMLKEAEKKGIKNNIYFTGWVSGDELKSAYHSCDLLIMPSICFDTFGMVCLEAMVCKKPVIATCFGGAKEVVADGLSGYLVNPFNIEMLSLRITEILNDSDKALKFGIAGYNRSVKYFNEDDQIRKILLCYNRS